MCLIKFFSIFLFFIINLTAFSASLEIDKLPFPPNALAKIKKHEIITDSIVTDYETKDKEKRQTMDFKSAGLHKKTCAESIPRIFNYESYQEKIEMITHSSYDDALGRISIILTAPIIKNRFGLNFKIPRITQPGSYDFLFDRGFLSGLKGTITVTSLNKHCLYFAKASWDGPHTGYSNLILSLFSKTAMSLSTNKLIRMSGSH